MCDPFRNVGRSTLENTLDIEGIVCNRHSMTQFGNKHNLEIIKSESEF